MRKNIQIKLIHLLGGISKSEAIAINHNYFHEGNIYARYIIKGYFIALENKLYGKSKQEWIDVIHEAIRNL